MTTDFQMQDGFAYSIDRKTTLLESRGHSKYEEFRELLPLFNEIFNNSLRFSC